MKNEEAKHVHVRNGIDSVTCNACKVRSPIDVLDMDAPLVLHHLFLRLLRLLDQPLHLLTVMGHSRVLGVGGMQWRRGRWH